MKHSRLDDHVFKKGKFVTPFNSLSWLREFEDEKSWVYGRMPEYLWIGLILKYFGREEGMKKLYKIVLKLHNIASDLTTLRLSQILKLDKGIQKEFFEYLVDIGVREALIPLTIILTSSRYSIFAEYFCCPEYRIDNRCESMIETMQGLMDDQSEDATDIRFVVLYYSLLSGKIQMNKEELELLEKYPRLNHAEEIMRIVRPGVRSSEMMILYFEEADSTFLKAFWRCISEMTDCSIYAINYPKEDRDITSYMEYLYEVFVYLSDLFKKVDPLNEKMNVLIGIATYSYKRFKEIYTHNLFNSICGRSCVRVLIEDYIMMKYLVKNEPFHDNIWRDYQLYGIGLYKLVLSRYRKINDVKETHVDDKYIEALVNEFKDEEFVDMDTRYFDKQTIRQKADIINEKNLYGLYYDYDSSYEHGLWGAIRESALLKCNNPAHQYHCVPDIDDETNLKSVLPDCVMIMNKTIKLLDDIYGIPEKIINEVISFEVKPSDG